MKNYTVSKTALQRLFDFAEPSRLQWLLRKTAEEIGTDAKTLKKELDV